MSLITAPALPINTIQWVLDRPAQINRSGLTDVRSAAGAPWFGRFSAKITLDTIVGESNFNALRSFLMRCKGAANSFNLNATVEPQNSNSGVTVGATVAAGVNSMTISGAATPLKAGQYVTVNGQLLLLTSAQSGSTINFEPQLRAQATAGTAVETANPFAAVQMANSGVSWAVSPYERYGVSFEVEEAF